MRIALNFKKIEYDYRPIHLVKDGGEQNTKEYKLLNPAGEVPFFIYEELGLGQSVAIMMYLDRKWPNPPIWPQNPEQRAMCIQLCEIINSGIQPLQNLKVLKYVDAKFDKMEWGKHWITRGFEILEKSLQKTTGKYSIGDDITSADCFLVPQVYNANRFKVEMEQFPTITRINDLCLEHSAFKASVPENQPDAS